MYGLLTVFPNIGDIFIATSLSWFGKRGNVRNIFVRKDSVLLLVGVQRSNVLSIKIREIPTFGDSDKCYKHNNKLKNYFSLLY